ncbi:MAG: tRNA (adenosine(37)-N6)-threonylcarbamoyltransferase complex dimerization subunit type 1 TsaB [Candidatus Dormibacteraeota bacterium]|nr:tRNA (adenosine(37)-N6)-threonylcarbamoyltransferase complex dimerization subunit type 1 TsaB [Candidatus Dormibacteraeota bacterium]
MSVIAIDSSSRDRAWAVRTAADGAVTEQRAVPSGQRDRALPGALGELLAPDVVAVVVLTGPGSYSGVRAGMAAALGLAAARGLPLHGIGSLTAVAATADVADDQEYSAVSDAGRGGVYVARFTRTGTLLQQLGPVQRATAAEVDGRHRVFATTEIPGLRAEQVDPVAALAGAVPRALSLPPLTALGLQAVHAEPGRNVLLARGG